MSTSLQTAARVLRSIPLTASDAASQSGWLKLDLFYLDQWGEVCPRDSWQMQMLYVEFVQRFGAWGSLWTTQDRYHARANGWVLERGYYPYRLFLDGSLRPQPFRIVLYARPVRGPGMKRKPFDHRKVGALLFELLDKGDQTVAKALDLIDAVNPSLNVEYFRGWIGREHA